jgi:maltooligosyltrehalose trehalohydrolase
MKRTHAMPFGATVVPSEGVRFRLWAPALEAVQLVLQQGAAEDRVPMSKGDGGWFETFSTNAAPGTQYAFAVDNTLSVPDPASRFQPKGVHGPSEVIDPAAFAWEDGQWRGRHWEESVFYELHVGAFSPEGTYAAAERRLDYLARLGVTAIELMPVSAVPGLRNWGYDGVHPFAPTANYGRPEELKAFVQAAHARDLMVFLDVVYNHFGPEGNYLHKTAPEFFTERHRTPWGAALDFESAESLPVRDFFVHNALYWLEEFNIDGLRLDAVHAIFDKSDPHILNEVAGRVRQAAPEGRHFHLVLENDKNEARFLERETDGRAKTYAAQWNDDIHHALHVIATGETSGYYEDYADDPIARLGRGLAEGFIYQGETSAHRGGAARGELSRHLPPTAFVSFLQNHDQIGNRALGDRISTSASPEAVRAATAMLLLAPQVPLLFMGEEWGSETPFLFFCDFDNELAAAVRDGRRREFAHFPAFADEAAQARIPDPADPETFARSKLDWESATHDAHRAWLELHTRLLAVRRIAIVPRLAGMAKGQSQFTRHAAGALDVTWTLGDGSRLRLRVNASPGAVRIEGPVPTGDELYCTHQPAPDGELPPWYVAFRLDGPSDAR